MKPKTVTGSGVRGGVTKTIRLNPEQKEALRSQEQDEYADLVRSAATGNTEALNRLLMRAQETAWRFSTAVCGHADDAEDAMQEALIKTYRYVGRIREPAAFRPWLYRTVRNACLMGRRKKTIGSPREINMATRRIQGKLPNRWRTTRDCGSASKEPSGHYRDRTARSCFSARSKVCRPATWPLCWESPRPT